MSNIGKATKQQTKAHNKRLVLKTIYENDRVSRADISRATRLARPTVSNIVSELIDQQYVVEVGLGTSEGGKRPTMLDVDHQAYNILSLDLGGQLFQGALLNLNSEIVKRIHIPAPRLRDNPSIDGVYELIDDLLALAKVPVIGIAIGSAGLIDPYKGFVHNAVHLGWQQIPLKTLLSDRYDHPIYLANNSQAAALAEYFENGKPDNLVVIKAKKGLGAGLIINGKPFYGSGFGAGEIGHVVVDANGDLCTCGNRGCLETIASPAALVRQAEATRDESFDWNRLCAEYSMGEPSTVALVDRAAHYLGAAVANLIAFLSIHTIIISGDMVQLGDTFLAKIQHEATRYTLKETVQNCTITYSTLGSDSVLLGSAALVLTNELGIV